MATLSSISEAIKAMVPEEIRNYGHGALTASLPRILDNEMADKIINSGHSVFTSPLSLSEEQKKSIAESDETMRRIMELCCSRPGILYL